MSRGKVGSLLLSTLLQACGGEPSAPVRQGYGPTGTPFAPLPVPRLLPNLVVVVIDSLRADAVGAREGVPSRMPFVESLAAKGVSFTDATTPSPWTLPSMVSMLTGVLPSVHGQRSTYADWHLPASFTTFAEILSSAYGYETAAFVNGPWFVSRSANLLQGFDRTTIPYDLQDLPSLEAWARAQFRRRPFLLLLHTYEAHEPYGEKNHPWPVAPIHRPPEIDPVYLSADVSQADLFRAAHLDMDVRLAVGVARGQAFSRDLCRYRYEGYAADPAPEMAAELAAAYWGGVTWVDGLLRKVHDLLAGQGLLANTLFVVTADHGEAFGEHDNLGHAVWLYEEISQVPLVMSGPPPFASGRVVDQPVSLTDLFPTFLDWVGLPPLEGIDGRSAMPIVRGETWCRPVLSEEWLSPNNTGIAIDAARRSVRTGDWKLVTTLHAGTGAIEEELYDLRADPGETRNLLAAGAPELEPCACAAVTALRERVREEAEALLGADDDRTTPGRTPATATTDLCETPEEEPPGATR
jgi:arylsulfatase A-like enzyme